MKISHLVLTLSLVTSCASSNIFRPISHTSNEDAKRPLHVELDEKDLVTFDQAKKEIESKEIEDSPITVTQYSVENPTIPEDTDNDDVSAEDKDPGMHLRYKQKHYDFWMNYFTKRDTKRFIRHLKNGEKYKTIVSKILKEHNLPEDLFYVALIESGFNTHIKSRASAVGPWQFIKGTADRYGLKVNRYLDERRNIHKATHAAANYFKDLYNIFGSWELALCAYNAGEYRIINAIRRGNTRDYRELVKKKLIPKETIYYIPKVVAAKKLAQTKFKDVGTSAWDKIHSEAKVQRVSKSFNVNNMAKRLGVKKSLLLKLNPDLRRGYIKISRRQKYNIVVPQEVNLTAQLKSSLHQAKKKFVKESRVAKRSVASKTTYKVRRGDNLTKIARKFNTRISTLRKYNRLRGNKIYVGQRLKVPASKRLSKLYIVKKGDNLYKIARKFGVSINRIVRANSLKRKTIFPNQRIRIPQNS
ncbi:MAG: LysM peptidoglycan-binding domain-containing protein [Oligoflexia bacterium]|nr:LysM peptidoglycan-binding domain-containing protein [Oligoflexia bacterium]